MCLHYKYVFFWMFGFSLPAFSATDLNARHAFPTKMIHSVVIRLFSLLSSDVSISFASITKLEECWTVRLHLSAAQFTQRVKAFTPNLASHEEFFPWICRLYERSAPFHRFFRFQDHLLPFLIDLWLSSSWTNTFQLINFTVENLSVSLFCTASRTTLCAKLI